MATGIGGLIGDIVDPIIEKGLAGLAARLAAGHPDITPAMQQQEVQGSLVEIQEALDIYKTNQQQSAANTGE